LMSNREGSPPRRLILMVHDRPLAGLSVATDQRPCATRKITLDYLVYRAFRGHLTRVFDRERRHIHRLPVEAVGAEDLVEHPGDSSGFFQWPGTIRYRHIPFFVFKMRAISRIWRRVSSGIRLYCRKNAVSSAISRVCSSAPSR